MPRGCDEGLEVLVEPDGAHLNGIRVRNRVNMWRKFKCARILNATSVISRAGAAPLPDYCTRFMPGKMEERKLHV